MLVLTTIAFEKSSEQSKAFWSSKIGPVCNQWPHRDGRGGKRKLTTRRFKWALKMLILRSLIMSRSGQRPKIEPSAGWPSTLCAGQLSSCRQSGLCKIHHFSATWAQGSSTGQLSIGRGQGQVAEVRSFCPIMPVCIHAMLYVFKGYFSDVKFYGDTYFTARATVWTPQNDEIKSTCIIMIEVSR